MTITLTKEELKDFQCRLRQGHAERAQMIVSTLVQRGDPLGGIAPRIEVNRDAITRWEKDNPEPDWRSLLCPLGLERLAEIEELGRDLFRSDVIQEERTKAAIRDIKAQGTRKVDLQEQARLPPGSSAGILVKSR